MSIQFRTSRNIISFSIAIAVLPSVTLAQVTSVDLGNYRRVARYALPEPTTVTPPTNSVLAQEASGICYNPDTNSLFVVGDGGTSIVQVSKTGQLINSMTLALGTSPQGTDFYDPEGIAYVGNGKFVFTEERDRRANLVTYAAGTTITHANAQSVKLGTTIGNVGLEGLTYDPFTGGYIFVKEALPQGIFQTTIDFAAGTASNGSATTVNSVNLFDPALLALGDMADVFSFSNVPSFTGRPDQSHLLVLSQESGKFIEIDRAGTIFSSLTITSDPGDLISIADMQHEGITMDNNGIIYTVCENGGGDVTHPQLWVYAPVPEPTSALLLAGVTVIARRTRHKH